MKTMKYLSMMLIMLTMSVCVVSCGKDDDEKKDSANSLAGTRWAYTDIYQDGTVEYTVSFFSDNTATYEINVKNAGGTIVDSQSIKYTYQRSDNLVIFMAQQAGKANLEGVISSNIKMELTNTSTQKVIGTFYKK